MCNKLDSNVVGFTTQEKKLAALFVAKTGPYVNIAIQIVSQQFCKTSCTCFIACFSIALCLLCTHDFISLSYVSTKYNVCSLLC